MSSGGRPTVITNEVVRKLEEALQDGFSVSEACLVSGISRTAYYERRSTDEAFAVKMELAQKYVTIRAKKTVIQAIKDGNFNAAKWWLERREREEFGPSAVSQAAKEQQQVQERQREQEDDTLRRLFSSLKDTTDAATTYSPTYPAS